jgi:DNA-binding XRE family transcriptional regulator
MAKAGRDFDELLEEIEQEAVAEGPHAVAELRALDVKYWFLNALIQRRRELGWTQQELAERSGVGQAEISRIERGSRSPTIETYSRLAAALAMEFPPPGFLQLPEGQTARKGGVLTS